jgi:hypothetical protein
MPVNVAELNRNDNCESMNAKTTPKKGGSSKNERQFLGLLLSE